jgi:hypothetical protein
MLQKIMFLNLLSHHVELKWDTHGFNELSRPCNVSFLRKTNFLLLQEQFSFCENDTPIILVLGVKWNAIVHFYSIEKLDRFTLSVFSSISSSCLCSVHLPFVAESHLKCCPRHFAHNQTNSNNQSESHLKCWPRDYAHNHTESNMYIVRGN